MNRLVASAREHISNAAKIVLLVIFCAAAGFIISFPLWKLATTAPGVYTTISLAVILAAAAFLAFRAIKKLSFISILRLILNIAIVVGGCGGAVLLLLQEKRLFALLAFCAMLFLCFLANSLLYEKPQD